MDAAHGRHISASFLPDKRQCSLCPRPSPQYPRSHSFRFFFLASLSDLKVNSLSYSYSTSNGFYVPMVAGSGHQYQHYQPARIRTHGGLHQLMYCSRTQQVCCSSCSTWSRFQEGVYCPSFSNNNHHERNPGYTDPACSWRLCLFLVQVLPFPPSFLPVLYRANHCHTQPPFRTC